MNGSKLETCISYLHGRIEREIEFQADRFGISPLELTTRLGALLIGEKIYNLPTMLQKTGKAHSSASEVEVVKRAHHRRTRKPHPLKGKKLDWWWKLSQKEKDVITAKRVASNKKNHSNREAA